MVVVGVVGIHLPDGEEVEKWHGSSIQWQGLLGTAVITNGLAKLGCSLQSVLARRVRVLARKCSYVIWINRFNQNFEPWRLADAAEQRLEMDEKQVPASQHLGRSAEVSGLRVARSPLTQIRPVPKSSMADGPVILMRGGSLQACPVPKSGPLPKPCIGGGPISKRGVKTISTTCAVRKSCARGEHVAKTSPLPCKGGGPIIQAPIGASHSGNY